MIPTLYEDTEAENICDNPTQQMDDHETVMEAEAALISSMVSQP